MRGTFAFSTTRAICLSNLSFIYDWVRERAVWLEGVDCIFFFSFEPPLSKIRSQQLGETFRLFLDCLSLVYEGFLFGGPGDSKMIIFLVCHANVNCLGVFISELTI